MKLTADRPFADPDKAARRLMEHAHAFEPIQDGRIYIEKLNGAAGRSVCLMPAPLFASTMAGTGS